MKKNKFIAYARVSTKGQSDNSIENQFNFIEKYAQETGLPIVKYWEKESGKNDNRIQLKNAIESLNKGDYFGVYNVKRLGRNTRKHLEVSEMIKEKGAYLQIAGETYNPDDEDQKFMFTIKAAVATKERKGQLNISRYGIDQKHAKGDWVFRSALYGYKIVKKDKNTPVVQIIESEAESIRVIYKEYLYGKSINQIAKNLEANGITRREGKKWTANTVRKTLINPIFMGFYRRDIGASRKGKQNIFLTPGDLVKSNLYSPIIPQAQWWQINKNYRTIQRKHSSQLEYRYAFHKISSLIKCKYCGSRYIHAPVKKYDKNTGMTKKIYYYYKATECKSSCPQTVKSIGKVHFEIIFDLLYILSFLIHKDIEEYVSRIKFKYHSSIDSLNTDIRRIENMIEEVTSEINNMKKFIKRGAAEDLFIDDFNEAHNKLNSLISTKNKLSENIPNYDEEIQSIVDDYSTDRIIEYSKLDEGGKRENLLLMLSGEVFDEELCVLYKTGMEVRIPLRKKRSKEYSLKIFRKGNLFSILKVNIETLETIILDQGLKRDYMHSLYTDLLEKQNIFELV